MPTSSGDPLPRRGEVWLADMDKRRPAVVVHRDFAGRVLTSVLVAPLTTRIRGIATEVRLGPADGLDRECVASLDNLTLLPKARLERRVGALTTARMDEICRAVNVALGCARA